MAAMDPREAARIARRSSRMALSLSALHGSVQSCTTITKLNYLYEHLQKTSLKDEEHEEFVTKLKLSYRQRFLAIGVAVANKLADELADLVDDKFGREQIHHDTDEDKARQSAEIVSQLRQRLSQLDLHRDFHNDLRLAERHAAMRDTLNRVVVVEMDSSDGYDSSSSETSLSRPTYRNRITVDHPALPSNNARSRLDELRNGAYGRAQNIVRGHIDPHRPRYDAGAWRKRCSEAYELILERVKHGELTRSQAFGVLETRRRALGAEAHTAWRPRQASESRQPLEEAIKGVQDAYADAVQCLQLPEKSQRDRQALRKAVEAYRNAFKNADAYVDDLTGSLRQNVEQIQRLTHARGQRDSTDWQNEVLTAFATVYSDLYEALGTKSVSAWTEQYLNIITNGLRWGQSCNATREEVIKMHNNDLRRLEIPPELTQYSCYRNLLAHSKTFKAIVAQKILDPLSLLDMWQRVQDSDDPMSLSCEFNRVLHSHTPQSHTARSNQPLVEHLASLYACLYSSVGERPVKKFEAEAYKWGRHPTRSQGERLKEEAVVLRHGLAFPAALPSAHRSTLIQSQRELTRRVDAAFKSVSQYLLLRQRLTDFREICSEAQSIRELNRLWNEAYAKALKITAQNDLSQSAMNDNFSQCLDCLASCYDFNYSRIGCAIVSSLPQHDSRVSISPDHHSSLRNASASEIQVALQTPEQTLRLSPVYYNRVKENQRIFAQHLATWQRQRPKSEWLTRHKHSKKRGLWKLAPKETRESHSERAHAKSEVRQQAGQSGRRHFRFRMW